MLRTDVENLVAHLFAEFAFEEISDSRFDVIVPGWRLPVRGVNELEKALSAKPEFTLSAAGDNYVAALFDGHYKGQPVQIYVRTTAVVECQ
jgi:hypothetical protein